jgi:hypothetical protein
VKLIIFLLLAAWVALLVRAAWLVMAGAGRNARGGRLGRWLSVSRSFFQ